MMVYLFKCCQYIHKSKNILYTHKLILINASTLCMSEILIDMFLRTVSTYHSFREGVAITYAVSVAVD